VHVVEGERFIIVEKIPGLSGEQNISPEKTRKAGKDLAKIHNYTEFEKEGWINFDGGKDLENKLENIRVEAFEDQSLKQKKLTVLEEKIERLDYEGLEELAEKVKAFVETHGEMFPEDFDAVLVHNDFTPDNVIYRDETISGIIDFDYAYSGLDVRNLVKSANGFWMHDPNSWDVREEFYEGYREERDLPENFRELEAFFRVETLVHLISGMIKLDELSKDEKDFYTEKIFEELERSEEILSRTG